MSVGRKTQIQSDQEGSRRGGKELSSEGRSELEEGVNAAERWRMEGGKEKQKGREERDGGGRECETKGGDRCRKLWIPWHLFIYLF